MRITQRAGTKNRARWRGCWGCLRKLRQRLTKICLMGSAILQATKSALLVPAEPAFVKADLGPTSRTDQFFLTRRRLICRGGFRRCWRRWRSKGRSAPFRLTMFFLMSHAQHLPIENRGFVGAKFLLCATQMFAATSANHGPTRCICRGRLGNS